METPNQNHIDKSDYEYVYEPREDSFLLLDALEKELPYLKAKNPAICLEVGSGSGIVITALGMVLPNAFCLSTDINFKACIMTKQTALHNNVHLDMVNMDLVTATRDNIFDVIVFNPPYVVTESEECKQMGIEQSWAGGVNGREVTDRLLDLIPKKLAPYGAFYLLLIEDNIPEQVKEIMSGHGFKCDVVMKRHVMCEPQLVLKFYKCIKTS